MHHRYIATTVILAAAALAACTAGSDPDPASPSTTAPPTTAAADRAELIKRCSDAIQAGEDTGDATSPECARLSGADYFEAIRIANTARQDALQSSIDGATP
ncbi:hypothetical protein [Streptomyces sp. SPB162]|uniref:hypothetical protein n=1 Tax=Streptomyces sp. SPB162 TaxID=2940560 RepID=UPI002405BD1D|nr:hypothetical protein [Streptomyces sp. SPB162]MDF9817242.1 hypothetical protein [Streptomyces sp. SPB162]